MLQIDLKHLPSSEERRDRYLTTEERAERLAARLRELGENPDLL